MSFPTTNYLVGLLLFKALPQRLQWRHTHFLTRFDSLRDSDIQQSTLRLVQCNWRIILGLVCLCAGGALRADPLDHWTLRYPLVSAEQLWGVTFDNNQFVAVGDAGTVLTSPNGVTWSKRSTETFLNLRSVARGNGTFMAVGDFGIVLTSIDGTTWTEQNSHSITDFLGVTFAHGLFVVVGKSGVILTTPDGVSWTAQHSGASSNLESITFGNGLFVAVGETASSLPTILTSADAVSWMNHSPAGTDPWAIWDVTYGEGVFVAAALGEILFSQDGMNWTKQRTSYALRSVTFANQQFVAVGPDNNVLVSTNGITWQHVIGVPGIGGLQHVTFGNGTFVVVGGRGILTSTDARTWTNQSDSITEGFGAVVYGNNALVASHCCLTASTFITTNGVDWELKATNSSDGLMGITYGNGTFFATKVGLDQAIVTSTDGLVWNELTLPSQPLQISGVIHTDGGFLAFGTDFTTNYVQTSPDGVAWTAPQVSNFTGASRIVYGQGLFVGVRGGNTNYFLLTSADGVTWTNTVLNISFGGGADIAFGDGIFVIVTANETYRSKDAVNWSRTMKGASPLQLRKIAYGNGFFSAVGYYEPAQVILTSPDGVTWTTHVIQTRNRLVDIVFGNNSFFAVGGGGYIGVVFQSDPVSPPYQVTAHAEYPTAFVPGVEPGRIRIARSGNSAIDIDLKVNLSLAGTVENGVDYRSINNAVVIPAGQASITIPVVAQGTLQTAWTRTLVLSVEAGEAYTVSASNSASVQIINPGQAPRFRASSTTRLADGTIRLIVDSPTGAVFTVDYSANMRDWQLLTTVTNSAGAVEIEDPTARDREQRFYRARLKTP